MNLKDKILSLLWKKKGPGRPKKSYNLFNENLESVARKIKRKRRKRV